MSSAAGASPGLVLLCRAGSLSTPELATAAGAPPPLPPPTLPGRAPPPAVAGRAPLRLQSKGTHQQGAGWAGDRLRKGAGATADASREPPAPHASMLEILAEGWSRPHRRWCVVCRGNLSWYTRKGQPPERRQGELWLRDARIRGGDSPEQLALDCSAVPTRHGERQPSDFRVRAETAAGAAAWRAAFDQHAAWVAPEEEEEDDGDEDPLGNSCDALEQELVASFPGVDSEVVGMLAARVITGAATKQDATNMLRSMQEPVQPSRPQQGPKETRAHQLRRVDFNRELRLEFPTIDEVVIEALVERILIGRATEDEVREMLRKQSEQAAVKAYNAAPPSPQADGLPVVVYMTRQTASRQVRDHCRLIQTLLMGQGIPHEKVDIAENRFLRRRLVLQSKIDTLPLIFVGKGNEGRFAGTYPQLQRATDEERFFDLLEGLGYRHKGERPRRVDFSRELEEPGDSPRW